ASTRCRRSMRSSARSSPDSCSSPPSWPGASAGLRRGAAMPEVRLFVSFPEELVDRPVVYEVVKRFDVVPNIRRANVEAHSGWLILELGGEQDAIDATIAYLEEVGCTVNTMEGDIIEG